MDRWETFDSVVDAVDAPPVKVWSRAEIDELTNKRMGRRADADRPHRLARTERVEMLKRRENGASFDVLGRIFELSAEEVRNICIRWRVP